MFQRTIFSALAVAAGALAAIAVKSMIDSKKENEQFEDDEEVRFIRISDDEEEEPAVYDASGKSEEVQKVCAVYPYLNPDFVEEKLADNDRLNEEYPAETLISLTHSALFKDSHAAESFSSIMDAAGYVCVDRSDYAVAATRKLFSEPGAITSDILNVANQAAALKGTYENCEIQ